MPRFSITLSDEVDKELKTLSEQTGRPIAMLIREALEGYLQEKLGREIHTQIKWGGYRERGSKTDETPSE